MMSNENFGEFNHVVAGFGNPLIDFTITLRDKTLLEKHNLKPDGQREVHCEEFNDILMTLKREKYDVTRSPGGCTQNTLRIIQALVNQPSFTVFFGSLGDDNEGEFLESEVERCGVYTRYARHPAHQTGRVAALINGENRSLVAHLGAAEEYNVEDLLTPENLKIMEEVCIVYVEGFFITHNFDVGLEIIKLCKKNGVVLVFNISGVYVAENCPKELLVMTNAADIVIGNVAEVKALANVMGLEYSTVESMALKVHHALSEINPSVKLKLNQMKGLGKTVIITQGKNPVLSVSAGNGLLKYEVPYLDPKLIKDPTGSGDAFAAGFLVAFLKDRSLPECLAYGCAIAQEITQHIGVHLPKTKSGRLEL